MRKRMTAIAMIVGGVLLCLAIALPVVAASNTSIIGGAGFPIFMFHFRKTAWMANVGFVMIVVSLIIRHKK